MKKKTAPIKLNANEKRIQRFASCLLMLRKMQDQGGAEFLKSLSGLSMQELNVLNTIGDHEPCIMRDVAKHTSLSLSSVTVIVDKLVKSHFVSRDRDETDRRVVYGTLTDKGMTVYHTQIEYTHSLVKKLLAALTIPEQENLLNAFEKITVNLTRPQTD